MSETKTVRVWDLPTRLFHWSLLVLVVVSWFTGEEEGLASFIHRLSGEAIVGLLVFRLIWGFAGGEYARFSHFFAPPAEIIAHIKELVRFKAAPTLGHNALGSLASLVLLLLVALVAITGLLSADGDRTGPLSVIFNVNLKDIHEPAFRVLQAMIVVHILGVAVTSFASRDNLPRAMITGAKKRPASDASKDAKPASMRALLAASAAAVIVAGGLMLMPHPPGEDDHTHDHDDH